VNSYDRQAAENEFNTIYIQLGDAEDRQAHTTQFSQHWNRQGLDRRRS
jgi:hypothetical protein